MQRPEAPDLAHCSFCGKSADEVGKIVAGPGVNICDECVALSHSIIEATLGSAAPKPRAAVWDVLTDAEMLTHIPRVAAHIDRAEDDLRAWVQELRRRGVTWTRIGEALGITRQSAWERFSGEE
jgi:hypothetical protein